MSTHCITFNAIGELVGRNLTVDEISHRLHLSSSFILAVIALYHSNNRWQNLGL